jgi:hypothetical protein
MARTALSDEELGRLLSLLKGADSVELKLTVPKVTTARRLPRSAWTRCRPRSARCSSSASGADPQRRRVVVRARRIQGKGDSVAKAAAGRPRSAPRQPAQVAQSGRGGRRLPGAATSARPRSRARRASTTPGRSPRAPARSASCSPSSSGRSTPSTPPRAWPGRPVGAGTDHPAQAQVLGGRVRPPAGHRTVVLPRRLTNPGAVHQVPAQPGAPSRRRGEGSC